MIDELENSAELLARSERESAWREMAKQVAHEIKNPLVAINTFLQLLAFIGKNGDWGYFASRASRCGHHNGGQARVRYQVDPEILRNRPIVRYHNSRCFRDIDGAPPTPSL